MAGWLLHGSEAASKGLARIPAEKTPGTYVVRSQRFWQNGKAASELLLRACIEEVTVRARVPFYLSLREKKAK